MARNTYFGPVGPQRDVSEEEKRMRYNRYLARMARERGEVVPASVLTRMPYAGAAPSPRVPLETTKWQGVVPVASRFASSASEAVGMARPYVDRAAESVLFGDSLRQPEAGVQAEVSPTEQAGDADQTPATGSAAARPRRWSRRTPGYSSREDYLAAIRAMSDAERAKPAVASSGVEGAMLPQPGTPEYDRAVALEQRTRGMRIGAAPYGISPVTNEPMTAAEYRLSLGRGPRQRVREYEQQKAAMRAMSAATKAAVAQAAGEAAAKASTAQAEIAKEQRAEERAKADRLERFKYDVMLAEQKQDLATRGKEIEGSTERIRSVMNMTHFETPDQNAQRLYFAKKTTVLETDPPEVKAKKRQLRAEMVGAREAYIESGLSQSLKPSEINEVFFTEWLQPRLKTL